MVTYPTESPPDVNEISPEEATQEIILSGGEPAEDILEIPPSLRIRSVRVHLSRGFAAVGDFFHAVGGSRAGLSVAVGLFAAFTAAIGFAVFDSGREQWMLKQKYPDAISADERYILYARDLMGDHRYSEAESILEDVVERNGKDGLYADAQFLLGKCLLASDADEASARNGRMMLDEFAERFSTDPRIPEAYKLVAESLAKYRLYGESTVRYKRLLRMLPDGREKGEIELLVARNYYEDDNVAAALIALRNLRQNYANTTIARDSTILLARTMIKNGDFEEAETVLRKLVEQAPRTAYAGEAMLLLAGAAAQKGEYERVMEYCEDWFRVSPISHGELDVMLLLARARLETGHPEETISLASEIFANYKKSPRFAEAAILMGRAYEALNDLEKAEGYYIEAIETDPSNWEPHWRLSRLRSEEGSWPEAIDQMAQAFDIAPNKDFLLLGLTKLYRLNGEEAKALSLLISFTRERQLSPQIGEAYLMLADIYLNRRDLQDAYTSLERLEALGATTTDLAKVYDGEGDILEMSGLHDTAIEKYRKALENGANRGVETLKIARVFLSDGRAQECLAELTEIDPASQSSDTRFDLFEVKANALMKLGRYAEARAEMLKAISQRSGREKYSTLALLMQANLELENDKAASEIFELTRKLIEDDTSESEFPSDLRYIVLGWAGRLYDIGKYAQAAEIYSSIAAPKFPLADAAWALYQQGNCYFHMAEYDQADAVYSRLAVEFAGSEWVQFAKAKEQMIAAGAGI